MSTKPRVILVGADKGGVGKTTVSRLLIDYLNRKTISPRIIDTQTPTGILNRFYRSAEVLDLTTDTGMMAALDGFNGSIVADIRAGLLTPTLEMMRDIGFLADVAKGKASLIVLHVLGPTIASVAEIEALKELVDFARYFLVKNHINEYDWTPSGTHFAPPIDVPCLSPLATATVDGAGLSYNEFIGDPSFSYVLRGRVAHWRGEVDNEWDRVNAASWLVD